MSDIYRRMLEDMCEKAPKETHRFEAGRTYRSLVFKDRLVTVMARSECYVTVRGAVDGRYHISRWLTPDNSMDCEYIVPKVRSGRPNVLAFYANDVVDAQE